MSGRISGSPPVSRTRRTPIRAKHLGDPLQLRRGEVVLLPRPVRRRAVRAPEVAPVGDRHPQVRHQPPLGVVERRPERVGSGALGSGGAFGAGGEHGCLPSLYREAGAAGAPGGGARVLEREPLPEAGAPVVDHQPVHRPEGPGVHEDLHPRPSRRRCPRGPGRPRRAGRRGSPRSRRPPPAP